MFIIYPINGQPVDIDNQEATTKAWIDYLRKTGPVLPMLPKEQDHEKSITGRDQSDARKCDSQG